MTYLEPQNFTAPDQILTYANDVSQGFYGIGMCLMTFFVFMIYLKLKGNTWQSSWSTASITIVFLAIGMRLLNLMSDSQLAIFIAVDLIGVVMVYFLSD